MKTIWTQHLEDQAEKVRFQTSLLHSKWLFERLIEILDSMEKGLDRQERSPKAYDSPNWDYRQAHANGFSQCLHTIRELVTLDPKEQDDRSISTARPV